MNDVPNNLEEILEACREPNASVVFLNRAKDPSSDWLKEHGFRHFFQLNQRQLDTCWSRIVEFEDYLKLGFIGYKIENFDIFSKFKKLASLSLQDIPLSVSYLKTIAQGLPQLTNLNLWNNSIGEAGAKAIAQGLPKLTNLNLWNNSIGEAGAKAIAQGLPQLTNLNLGYNSIGEAAAKAIAQGLPQLTNLNLGFNSIGEAGAKAIAQGLPQLTNLNLGHNSIGEAGAKAIAQGLPQLTNLNLWNNSIGEAAAKAIAQGLPQLTNLNLWNNSIGEAGAKAIAQGLPQLTNLNLRNNSIGEAGAKAIAQGLPQLTNLNLGHNSIGDAGAKAIAQGLPQLTNLNLEYSSIGQAGAKAIAQGLPQLTYLDIASNSIGEAGAKAIAQGLPQLTNLDIASNSIGQAGAKAIAQGLPQLTYLNLSGNSIGEAGAKAIVQGLPQLTNLNLRNNSIGESGAKAIAQGLPQLTNLNLWDNSIGEAGAKAIAHGLPQLTNLNLWDNSIGEAGAKAIAQGLPQLTNLNLRNNSIGEAGAKAIAQGLPQLTNLDLSGNSIGEEGIVSILNAYENTAISYLNLGYNPGCEKLLQREAFSSPDAQSLLAAWRAFNSAKIENALIPLNAAKLIIVGNEAVGKTSLVKYLVKNQPCNPNEQKTPGISHHDHIETSQWHPDGCDIKLNIWDFGGQEIMHGTHRYFLTERSVYLLVLEDRREDNPPVEPWMKIIRSYGGPSPVLVVINKSDEGKAALKLDENTLRRKFPQIEDFFRTSCEGGDWSDESISKLRAYISHLLNTHEELEPIRNSVPREWNAIKEAIAIRAREESIMEHDEFSKMCVDASIVGDRPISDAPTQTALLRLLHELGVIVAHGLSGDSSVKLPNITLLDPNWLTGAIYTVLNSAKLDETGGVFSPSDLTQWLDSKKYPAHHHEFIISMMRDPDIGLCFRLPGESETYLAPEALPRNSPDYSGFMDGVLRFRYRYSFLPRNILPRFLVKAQDCIPEDRPVWRSGGKLKSHGCDILIQGDQDRKVVDIAVKGQYPREALAVIRQHFMAVHKQFGDLDVSRIVPMPDDPDVEEDFDYLLRLEKEEGADYKHRPTGASRGYHIKELLDNITLTRKPIVGAELEIAKAGNTAPKPNTVKQYLTVPNLFAGLLSILSFFLMKLDFNQSVALSAILGLGTGAAAFALSRLFDRGFLFRRLFTLWVMAGVSMVSIWFLSGTLNLSSITVDFNNQVGLPSLLVWIIGFIVLGIFARGEAGSASK